MAEPQFYRTEADGVLEFVINRPEKYNACSWEILNGWAKAVEDLRDRDDLGVLLIRSNGKFFSSGYDLAVVTTPDLKGSHSGFRKVYRKNGQHDTLDAFEAVEKPIIVAHQGPCLGGSLEMSLSCDFRIAGRSARYGMPEIDMGFIPGSGGTSRLVRQIGTHWARWMIMSGEQVDADWALNAGLVHQVVDDDALEETAWRIARRLAKRPPEAMAAAKLAIELAQDLDRGQGRNVERILNAQLNFGVEHKELMAALRAKLGIS